jgi:hypothetical protein
VGTEVTEGTVEELELTDSDVELAAAATTVIVDVSNEKLEVGTADAGKVDELVTGEIEEDTTVEVGETSAAETEEIVLVPVESLEVTVEVGVTSAAETEAVIEVVIVYVVVMVEVAVTTVTCSISSAFAA